MALRLLGMFGLVAAVSPPDGASEPAGAHRSRISTLHRVVATAGQRGDRVLPAPPGTVRSAPQTNVRHR